MPAKNAAAVFRQPRLASADGMYFIPATAHPEVYALWGHTRKSFLISEMRQVAIRAAKLWKDCEAIRMSPKTDDEPKDQWYRLELLEDEYFKHKRGMNLFKDLMKLEDTMSEMYYLKTLIDNCNHQILKLMKGGDRSCENQIKALEEENTKICQKFELVYNKKMELSKDVGERLNPVYEEIIDGYSYEKATTYYRQCSGCVMYFSPLDLQPVKKSQVTNGNNDDEILLYCDECFHSMLGEGDSSLYRNVSTFHDFRDNMFRSLLALVDEVCPSTSRQGKELPPARVHPVALAAVELRKRQMLLDGYLLILERNMAEQQQTKEKATARTRMILKATDLKMKRAHLEKNLQIVKHIDKCWDQYSNGSKLVVCLKNLDKINVEAFLTMTHLMNSIRRMDQLYNPDNSTCPMCEKELYREDSMCPMCKKVLTLRREFYRSKRKYEELRSKQLELSKEAAGYQGIDPENPFKRGEPLCDMGTLKVMNMCYVTCFECIRQYSLQDTSLHGIFLPIDKAKGMPKVKENRLPHPSENTHHPLVSFCKECFVSKYHKNDKTASFVLDGMNTDNASACCSNEPEINKKEAPLSFLEQTHQPEKPSDASQGRREMRTTSSIESDCNSLTTFRQDLFEIIDLMVLDRTMAMNRQQKHT